MTKRIFTFVAITSAALPAVAQMLPAYTIKYSGVDKGMTATAYTYTEAVRSNGDSMIAEQGHEFSVYYRSIGTWVKMSTVNPRYKMTGGDGKPVPITVYAPNCAGLRDLTGESKEILGIKVLHMVTNGSQKAADGSILTHVEDAWLAPSFNCKALYDHQTWTYNGKPDGDKEEVATSAVLGEPDAALFQIHGEEATPEVFYAATGYPKAGPPKMKQYLADKAARAALGLP